jgi:hypothetical protein
MLLVEDLSGRTNENSENSYSFLSDVSLKRRTLLLRQGASCASGSNPSVLISYPRNFVIHTGHLALL